MTPNNDTAATSDVGPVPVRGEQRGVLAAAWNAVSAVIGFVMGLLPHVLHHIGLLAGAALVSGVAGNLLFGALGLLLSIPMLRRLHRHFGTWKAPATALVLFAAMFALSALVIGPAISGSNRSDVPSRTPDPSEHEEHHAG